MSNEELVALIQAGERDRLPELWEQVEKYVKMRADKRARTLKGFGGVIAEDLYQSGYIAFVAAVSSYDQEIGGPFRCWLEVYLKKFFAEAGFYHTKKRALDPIHRAESIDTPIDEGEYGPITLSNITPDDHATQAFYDVEDRIWLEQLRAALDAALEELPNDQAEVLRHSYYIGQTPAKAAAALGISVATSYRRKEKALHALRQRQELRRFLQD